MVSTPTAAATLRGLSAVSYVEGNGRISGEDTRLTPNDPSFTSKELIGLDNDGTIVGTADADINAPDWPGPLPGQSFDRGGRA